MKIVCGIPTINRADLLVGCLSDLAEKIPDLDVFVVDNGHQELPANLPTDPMIDEKADNIGVAASWNQIMSYAFDEEDADYALILNDDIKLGLTMDDLQKAIEKYSWWGHAPLLMVAQGSWGVFLIHRKCREIVGEFDPEFFPGMYEDADYAYRLRLALPDGNFPDDAAHRSSLHGCPLDVKWQIIGEYGPGQKARQEDLVPALPRDSGWGVVFRVVQELSPETHWCGATHEKSPELHNEAALEKRYIQKWGGIPGRERFAEPFEGEVTFDPGWDEKREADIAALLERTVAKGKAKTGPQYRRGDERVTVTE
jgi:hypothetical protein